MPFEERFPFRFPFRDLNACFERDYTRDGVFTRYSRDLTGLPLLRYSIKIGVRNRLSPGILSLTLGDLNMARDTETIFLPTTDCIDTSKPSGSTALRGALGSTSAYCPPQHKRNSYAGEISPEVANIVNRDFHADEPNAKWLTDITEFSIPAGKVYLSPIIDCFDGLAVSWSIGTSPSATLANTMLDEAISLLKEGEHPIIILTVVAITGGLVGLSEWTRLSLQYVIINVS